MNYTDKPLTELLEQFIESLEGANEIEKAVMRKSTVSPEKSVSIQLQLISSMFNAISNRILTQNLVTTTKKLGTYTRWLAFLTGVIAVATVTNLFLK